MDFALATKKQNNPEICKKNITPLPSHFSPTQFTLAVINNFDHSDANSLAGIFVAQGAAMTFSKLSQLQIQKKSLKSDINLKRISSISLPSQGITKSSTNKMINIPKNFDVNDELLY